MSEVVQIAVVESDGEAPGDVFASPEALQQLAERQDGIESPEEADIAREFSAGESNGRTPVPVVDAMKQRNERPATQKSSMQPRSEENPSHCNLDAPGYGPRDPHHSLPWPARNRGNRWFGAAILGVDAASRRISTAPGARERQPRVALIPAGNTPFAETRRALNESWMNGPYWVRRAGRAGGDGEGDEPHRCNIGGRTPPRSVTICKSVAMQRIHKCQRHLRPTVPHEEYRRPVRSHRHPAGRPVSCSPLAGRVAIRRLRTTKPIGMFLAFSTDIPWGEVGGRADRPCHAPAKLGRWRSQQSYSPCSRL